MWAAADCLVGSTSVIFNGRVLAHPEDKTDSETHDNMEQDAVHAVTNGRLEPWCGSAWEGDGVMTMSSASGGVGSHTHTHLSKYSQDPCESLPVSFTSNYKGECGT